MGKDNELLHAVKNGDVSSIRKLLQKFKSGQKGKKSVIKKVHINAPDEDGFTALHHAALVNNVEVVLALIDMDADPNSRDKKGMCPLHMASWAGKDQVVKALLDNRALVNLPSFGGETPLLLASQHGYANVVEVLLKYNADPTIRNNDLESPLDLACQFGHAAAVRLLLMRGEVVHMLRDRHLDIRYKKPLHLAAKGGHNDVIRLLIESGADVNEESSHGTSLHLAALYGKVDVIKLLLEAGADVYAKNKKNMTPLDMVNQFTTSRAGIEIKQLLREAAGERILYARAVTDNVNVYDPTCLQFKSGDTVTVLEQNEDGRWKGSVINGQEERVGFFPAKAVKLISKRRDTQSLGSMSSSSDSSISSASSKDINQVPTSPSRRMTDSRQPVGVVPIGSFEVLTLATGQTQEKKKPANIPRLNSFKKGLAPPRARKTISYEETQEEPSNSVDTSMDSGVDSHAGGEPFASTSYDRLPHPIKAVEPSFYDPVPPQNVSGSRNVAMDGQQAQNGSESRHVAMDGQKAQQASQENFHQRQSVPSGVNYADILVRPNGEKPSLSPSPHAMPSGYSQVYVSDRPVWHEQDHGITSNVVPIPEKIHNQQPGFKESYEKMDFTEESLARHSRSPEERSSLISQSRTRGYEDMRANSPIDEPFPSPPLLPVKGQSFIYNEDEVPLPPKKIESRAIKGRQDSYENVKPRQIVPVHAQNPFDKHPRAAKEQLTSPHQPPQPPLQDQTAAYGEYQNYKAPGLPMLRSNTNTYENYRPPEVDDRIIRAATMSEKQYRVPISRPVPLPPKMNRRSSQEAATLQPFSPSDASSNSPFFCQMNLDDLQEDERELLSWLIDLKLPQYFHNFQIEGYDMISVRGISPEDLTAVNITKAGHKKKLLSEIAKLGQSNKLPSYKPDDVGVWLGLLCLKSYEENFIEGGFDDMDFIKDLDLADLEMIEIRKKGHQKKLLLAVQKLSDIELTADLDKVVQVSSTNQPMKEPQQQQQESSRHYDIRENENSLSTPQRSYQEIPKAPPPPPVDSFDKSFLSNRDNLPPPSGTESISSSHDPLQPVPPRAPIHFTQTASKPSVTPEPLQPIARDRSATSPNAPRPKPKPKPDQNRGQVRTATEYHATESPGKSVILPSPVVSPKPASQFSTEEPDDVTATRSRDFGQQQQQQPATTTTTMNTPNRQKSLSTGVKPLTSPRPLPKPKPKPSIKAKAVIEPPRDSPSTNGVTTPRSAVKKVPPPAPPRRDSMKKKEKMVEPEAEIDAEVVAVDRPRTMSGPLDEKIRGVFRGNKHGAPRPVQAAVLEMEQEEEKEIENESNIVEELEATDSIMADIDNMIADFNTQLDSMF